MRHNRSMRIRRRLPLALAILTAARLLGSATNSVDDVVRTILDANRLQVSDANLARALRKLNLNVRLDDRTAEELESEAPGPRCV